MMLVHICAPVLHLMYLVLEVHVQIWLSLLVAAYINRLFIPEPMINHTFQNPKSTF